MPTGPVAQEVGPPAPAGGAARRRDRGGNRTLEVFRRDRAAGRLCRLRSSPKAVAVQPRRALGLDAHEGQQLVPQFSLQLKEAFR